MKAGPAVSGEYWRAARWRWMFYGVLLLLVFACGGNAQAPPNNTADTFILQYRASRAAALAAFANYAQGTFRVLALCEMAWVGVLLVLERSDLQGFTATLLRKLLVLFFFFWLLQNGAGFSDLIMRSFSTYGWAAAGGGPGGGIGAGEIVWKGIEIAMNLIASAGLSALLAGPAGVGVVILCAVIVVISFGVVALQYIMAVIESVICVSAGLLFLAFGGSSVTRPYVERYFALSVAVGVKLMVCYIVIGIGERLTDGWAALARDFALSLRALEMLFDMMVGAIIYAVVAWGVPRFAAALLSGSPAFSGGDILSMGFSIAQGGIAVTAAGALAVRGGGMLALAAASRFGGGAPDGGGGGPSGSGGRPGGGPDRGRGDAPGPASGEQAPPPASNGSASPHSERSTGSGSPAAPGGAKSGGLPADNNTGTGSSGSNGRQVAPPGSKWATVATVGRYADRGGDAAFKGAYRAAQMAHYLQRIFPHEGGGHGAPPVANMHGE